MSFFLTWGFDRGIGVTVPASPYGQSGSGVVGTAPPTGSVIITDTSGTHVITLQEDADSPTIERGTQCTAQHRFTMGYEQALSLINVIGMGLIVQDSGIIGAVTIWRVLTCSIQSESGGRAKLITVSESLSFDLPPDEFQVNTVDLGIDIIKHPRYFPNLYPTTAEFGTIVGQIKSSIIMSIQAYRDAPFFPSSVQLQAFLVGRMQYTSVSLLSENQYLMTVPNPNFVPHFKIVYDTTIQQASSITPLPAATADGQINDPSIPVSVSSTYAASIPSVQLAMAAAQEIITKLWRMEDSPYLAGIEIKYSFYSFLPIPFNMGSYLEDPTYIIPEYFINPDRPLTELPPRGTGYPVSPNDTIFEINAALNPQDFSGDGTASGATQISWLRKADETQWERGLCKTTFTWVGSAIGYFDTQLYGASNRPDVPGDYQTFS